MRIFVLSDEVSKLVGWKPEAQGRSLHGEILPNNEANLGEAKQRMEKDFGLGLSLRIWV